MLVLFDHYLVRPASQIYLATFTLSSINHFSGSSSRDLGFGKGSSVGICECMDTYFRLPTDKPLEEDCMGPTLSQSLLDNLPHHANWIHPMFTIFASFLPSSLATLSQYVFLEYSARFWPLNIEFSILCHGLSFTSWLIFFPRVTGPTFIVQLWMVL